MDANNSKQSVSWVMYVADKGKNSCPVCLANHGKKFSTKDPKLPQLPIHPNCRCKYIQVATPQDAYNKVQKQLQKKTDEIILAGHDKKRNVTDEAQEINLKEKLYQNNKISKDAAEKLATQISHAKKTDSVLKEQNFFLMFNGRHLAASNGELLLDAVSGKPVKKSKPKVEFLDKMMIGYTTTQKIQFDYSKKRQAEKNTGGIPEGKYYIKLEEQRSAQTSRWSHIVKRTAWGAYSWSMHKADDTDAKGRSGFFIHGGDNPGSAGCIDVTSGDIKLEKYLQNRKQGVVYIYVKYDKNIVKIEETKSKIYPYRR
jgi:Tlde1 domain